MTEPAQQQPQQPSPDKDSVLETIHQAKVDQPKGSRGVFELPCGYLDPDGDLHTEVEVREITGYEEDMLGSKTVPNHKKIGQLVTQCVLRVGNITEPGRIAMIAEELTVGDRVFLMFCIRRTSLGDDYPFRDQCPECNYKGIFNLDLADLEVKEMHDRKNRVFDITLPSGTKARFRPLVGKDEEKLSKASNSKDAMTLAILLRLESLGDEPPNLKSVKSLGIKDRNALRDGFDSVEGGVDTTLEMQCPSCGAEFERELDVGQAGFFFPSSVLKGSKTKSSP